VLDRFNIALERSCRILIEFHDFEVGGSNLDFRTNDPAFGHGLSLVPSVVASG
jgi:hypothetical protein